MTVLDAPAAKSIRGETVGDDGIVGDDLTIVDLFAGPGGWSWGLRMLGLRDLGVELDAAACATRAAAGLSSFRGDVAALDPVAFLEHVGAGYLWGLIASPPCQLFSLAGKRTGCMVMEEIARGILDLSCGDDTRRRVRAEVTATILPSVGKEMAAQARKRSQRPPTEAEVAAEATRLAFEACLVLEPIRWARELRPAWVALEQVPAVLPLWEVTGRALTGLGYSAWWGKLNTADYGVPQTRVRAILMASRETNRVVHPPAPTHAEYPADGLFGPSLAPWVSMAEALGWAGQVGFPRRDDRGDSPDGYLERDWHDTDSPAMPDPPMRWKGRKLRPGIVNGRNRRHYELDEPAPTLAFGHDAASWVWENDAAPTAEDLEAAGAEWVLDRPATTVCGANPGVVNPHGGGPDVSMSERGYLPWGNGERLPPSGLEKVEGESQGEVEGGGLRDVVDLQPLEPHEGVPTYLDNQASPSARARPRPVDEPAPTITGRGNDFRWTGVPVDRWSRGEAKDPDWPAKRPAITVAGDPRIAQPGGKAGGTDKPKDEGWPGRMEGSIRVEPWEAGVLQSFPPDYPWQGNRTQVFEQIGNAVPPLLAAHIVRALTAPKEEE